MNGAGWLYLALFPVFRESRMIWEMVLRMAVLSGVLSNILARMIADSGLYAALVLLVIDSDMLGCSWRDYEEKINVSD